jgi:Flp pilus assembly protein TadB
MVILIVACIIAFALIYTNTVNTNQFLEENDIYLKLLKEKDWDFYVSAKYGDKKDPNELFRKRIKETFVCAMVILLVIVTNFSFINLVFFMVLVYFIYKSYYTNLRSYYKRYMSKIDQMLPYYLKGLEILCQNYTVPVALARSIEDAPDIFKPGLRIMIEKINNGDSSIQPYMDFANQYPVRDSMRMMRLLYRLGLGAQENKYQQLTMFSKSVSSLQNKAREDKYKQRLSVMEKKTMIMLVVTGGGTMIILVFAMLLMMG